VLRCPTAAGPVVVRGVWRDYARQHGAVVMDQRRLPAPDRRPRSNDAQLWLAPGAHFAAGSQARCAALARAKLGCDRTCSSSPRPREIRAVSLRIFDRSFAVTYWLQAVAIAIGLFGIAASFSAQVLARRKEFGLLAHLGLTRRQILAVVGGRRRGAGPRRRAARPALGLAVSVVLVHVVNPQSFHWTMDLLCPGPAARAVRRVWWPRAR
jgi:putative ABC transport system permease protein